MNTQKRETAYTPGPWRIGDKGEARGGARHILGEDDLMKVATVESFPAASRGKADAMLISAAPELLEASLEVLEELESGFIQPASLGPRVMALRAAIHKATDGKPF